MIVNGLNKKTFSRGPEKKSVNKKEKKITAGHCRMLHTSPEHCILPDSLARVMHVPTILNLPINFNSYCLFHYQT